MRSWMGTDCWEGRAREKGQKLKDQGWGQRVEYSFTRTTVVLPGLRSHIRRPLHYHSTPPLHHGRPPHSSIILLVTAEVRASLLPITTTVLPDIPSIFPLTPLVLPISRVLPCSPPHHYSGPPYHAVGPAPSLCSFLKGG